MRIKLDKETAQRARSLAFNVDDLKTQLIGRLSEKDELTLDRATEILYRISKEKAANVQL